MKDLFQIVRDGDAGGAAGQGGAAPGAAGGAPAAAPAGLAAAAAAAVGAQGGADGGAAPAAGADGNAAPGVNGAPYFPEGLPDQFKGQSEREVIDKLYSEIANRPKPPATPKDYKFELSPDMQQRVGDLKDDKVLPIWAEVAHELGLDDKQYSQAFEKLYTKMEKAGLIEAPPDYGAELQKLQPKAGTERERLLAAQQRINGADAWIKGLESGGALTKAQAAILHASTDTAEGIMLIESLQKAFGGTGIVAGGAPSGGQRSKDAIKADMADARYDPLSPKYDKAFQERVDKEYRATYGVG